MSRFSHLHCHTQYSLLDGAANIQSLYKKAIKNNMPAIAITDHGNMFGAFEFVSEAYKHKGEDGKPLVKPVVGCEFYVVKDRHRKSFTKEQKDERYHQVLLAKNAVGYQNLIKLTSLGYTEGMYSKYPRIDKELIGAVAAKIKSLRKVEPYKGKGIRFVGEQVRRKAGKSASKK